MSARRVHALVLTVAIVAVTLITWAISTTLAHADDTPTPSPTVLPSVNSLPVRSATPSLLPATTTTITLDVDAETLVPSTVRPVRLANTGGPDLGLLASCAVVALVISALVGWLLQLDGDAR